MNIRAVLIALACTGCFSGLKASANDSDSTTEVVIRNRVVEHYSRHHYRAVPITLFVDNKEAGVISSGGFMDMHCKHGLHTISFTSSRNGRSAPYFILAEAEHRRMIVCKVIGANESKWFSEVSLDTTPVEKNSNKSNYYTKSDTISAMNHLFFKRRRAGRFLGIWFSIETIAALQGSDSTPQFAFAAIPIAVGGFIELGNHSLPNLENQIREHLKGKPLPNRTIRQLQQKHFKKLESK